MCWKLPHIISLLVCCIQVAIKRSTKKINIQENLYLVTSGTGKFRLEPEALSCFRSLEKVFQSARRDRRREFELKSASSRTTEK